MIGNYVFNNLYLFLLRRESRLSFLIMYNKFSNYLDYNAFHLNIIIEADLLESV